MGLNSDRQNRLISQIEQAKAFLSQRVGVESVYSDLIDFLDSLVNSGQFSEKPIVKIVSPSIVLAESLKQKSTLNESLRSLYEFEVVAPITQIHQILHHCDLLCFLYDSTHQIRHHHHQLIELALKQHISIVLLVHRQSSDTSSNSNYPNWLSNQNHVIPALVQLPGEDFFDLNNFPQLDLYQRSLIDLSTIVEASFFSRIEQATKQQIKVFFNREITSCWQSIKLIREQYLAGEHLYLFQQQLHKTINQSGQYRQQIVRGIKQQINHTKADLLNPFLRESLIFSIQQIIDTAQVRVIQETDKTYLYLVLSHVPHQPYLHDYILEFCQQKTAEILALEWSQINHVYGNGGLEAVHQRIDQDLATISALLDAEFNEKMLKILPQSEIELQNFIDPNCLKINSRIWFDYSFVQSSWFRIFVSLLMGSAIYFATLLLFGSGKYIGFIIIIFQIINLIIGQDIKKAKLKQHTRELKRTVDQKYQSLVRIIINQIAQSLIVAVDQQSNLDQEYWLEGIAIAQSKLDELKQTSDQSKSRVENLEQDRDKIQSWFN